MAPDRMTIHLLFHDAGLAFTQKRRISVYICWQWSPLPVSVEFRSSMSVDALFHLYKQCNIRSSGRPSQRSRRWHGGKMAFSVRGSDLYRVEEYEHICGVGRVKV